MQIRSSIGPYPLGKKAWNSLVVASKGHIMQTWQWGQLKAEVGWQPVRVALEEASSIVAGAQILFRPLPLGASIAYIPKGPIVDFPAREVTEALFSAVNRIARRKGAVFLKIEPDLPDDLALEQRLKELGFHPSSQTVQPRRTILVDLKPTLDDILMRMKSKTRYNIRLTGRKGVKVQEGMAADLDAFYRLMRVTSKRDEFGVHSREYYEAAYRLFVSKGLAKLFLATYKGKVLAGLMAFALGDAAWYFYGASSSEERNRMPNYALQWAAIQWAKERGCLTYDLWGVPDEDEETLEEEFLERSDGLWGLYRFKRGFGGEAVRYVGAYDYVYSPPLYRLGIKLWSVLQR